MRSDRAAGHGTATPSFRIDNAKAVLVGLVVWGHLIEEAALAGGLATLVYGAIYVFHMPAFALISGAVSKSTLAPGAMGRLSKRILLPLIVFQILYSPFLSAFAPTKVGGLLTPHWILWFLLSLAAWRLMLPLFVRLKFPVLTAIALALAMGFVDEAGRTLSLSRTFYFFPAFVFGHLYAGTALARVQTHKAWCAIGMAVILGAAAYLIADGMSVYQLFGSLSYAALPDFWAHPVLARAILIAVGIVASLFLLALIPDTGGMMSRIGQETLAVFLLHGFVAVILWRIMAQFPDTSEIGFLVLTLPLVVFIVVGIAMASRAVKRRLSG